MIKESYINKKTVEEVLQMYDIFEAFGDEASDYMHTYVENGVIYSVQGESYARHRIY